MDGFTKANEDPSDPTGSRTMGYYDRTDLPFYYGLDNTFATSDTYFDSVLSQTFPNRFYELAGTSFGHIRNDFPTDQNAGFTQKTVVDEVDVLPGRVQDRGLQRGRPGVLEGGVG